MFVGPNTVPDVALRTGCVQGIGDGQRRFDRSVGVHVDRSQRRSVFRHREPNAKVARVHRRTVRHQVHAYRGRGHLGGGRGVCRARRPVLVRPPVSRAQRHPVRSMLSVLRAPWARLSQDHGDGQVPRLLCRPARCHRLLLRAHRSVPVAHHQQHARRTTGVCLSYNIYYIVMLLRRE